MNYIKNSSVRVLESGGIGVGKKLWSYQLFLAA